MAVAEAVAMEEDIRGGAAEMSVGGKLFMELVKSGVPVVFDGAMGSALYAEGRLHTRAFEEANLSDVEKVRAVHDGYIAVGAQVIETNTFGANVLALERIGCASSVTEICRAGVTIAREAADAADTVRDRNPCR